MICSSILWTVLILFISDLGGTKTQIGLIRMISTAVAILFGPALGKFSDRVGRRPILLFSMACFTLYFGLCFFAENVIIMFPITLLEGIGTITTGTIAPAFIADIVSAEERGWAMGTYNRIQNIGWLIGFGLGGYLADVIGYRSTFLASTGLMTVGFFMALIMLRERNNKTLKS